MSLREKFREGLYDSEHKPRLNFARNYFLEFSLDQNLVFKEFQKFYLDWRDKDEYVVLQKQSENLKNKGEAGEISIVAIQAMDIVLVIFS